MYRYGGFGDAVAPVPAGNVAPLAPQKFFSLFGSSGLDTPLAVGIPIGTLTLAVLVGVALFAFGGKR
jgi:hypothetical protein